jgi:hypothetical protein
MASWAGMSLKANCRHLAAANMHVGMEGMVPLIMKLATGILAIVTIEPTDVAFETLSCRPWGKVG